MSRELWLITMGVSVFFVGIICQEAWIKFMNKRQLEQVQKAYGPKSHLIEKTGIPSMGGVVFLTAPVVLVILSLIWKEQSGWSLKKEAFIWLLPFCTGAVGFMDDWLKLWRRSSEGLRSMHKFWIQILITLPWCLWAGYGGFELLPGFELPPAVAIPLLVFVASGIQNAVNVTDGLDGLLSGAMIISFAVAAAIMSGAAASASVCGIALCSAFLWHNGHPARVFMGDAGSHFLAGLLMSICVAGGGLVFVVPLGFLFGLEILSVSIQLIAIHRFGRKVFKMSPVHHHFELCGWKETRIVTRFWLVHLVGMMLILMVMGALFGGVSV